MTRTFQRITSLILVSLALSLGGCKTGDTSLDKLVGSVSDAVSEQRSTPQPQPLSTKELCSTPGLIVTTPFTTVWNTDKSLSVNSSNPANDGAACLLALEPMKKRSWTTNSQFLPSVRLAKSRGFSVSDCMAIVASGPDTLLYDQETGSATMKYSVTINELSRRGITPKQCAKLVGLKIPTPLADRTSESLCREFEPFSVGKFSASLSFDQIGSELNKRKVTVDTCMRYAGKAPPKPASKASIQRLCGSTANKDAISELGRRGFSEASCLIVRGDELPRNTYLMYTPSEKITPYLTDLNLCRFLKFKKPPHLKAAVKKRRLRCEMLLRLDEFERSMN